MKEALKKTKAASRLLATIPDAKRNEVLLAVADAIIANKERILKANAEDLAKMDPKNPLYDRLQLTTRLAPSPFRPRTCSPTSALKTSPPTCAT